MYKTIVGKPLISLDHLMEGLAGFTLAFHDPETHEAEPARFIEDEDALAAFHDLINVDSFEPSHINYALTHEGLARTKSGHEFRLEFAKVEDGGGYLMLADGHVRLRAGFAALIAQLFDKPGYRSDPHSVSFIPEGKRYWQEGAAPASQDEIDARAQSDVDRFHQAFAANGPAADVSTICVIFYNKDHNEVFARTLAEKNPGKYMVFAVTDEGAAYINSVVRSIAGLGTYKIDQIMMSVHGSDTAFMVGPKGSAWYSDMVVGLHPGQYSPSKFAADIQPSLSFAPTLTLLSCDTAEKVSDTYNGRITVQNLALMSQGFNTASDELVYIYKYVPKATTAGNIWRSYHGTAAWKWKPAPGGGAQQTYPLGAI